jgi:phosphatidylserine/phosphatidylglycerophosphate/cardiolipin synthase-like enzyme
MPVRRSSTALLVIAVVASLLSIAGVSSAAAPTSAPTTPAAKSTPSAARVAGQPPQNYLIPATSYFGYPNRSKADKQAIRGRVLRTINSTWGGRKTPGGLPLNGNGTIRLATWTFKDWNVARALVNARTRGVSVQVIAASKANKENSPAWRWLKKKFGQRLYRPGHPETRDKVSFARECRGACRGAGGTAHSKYFLFSNVSSAHRSVVIQTSMNLTPMGYQGQWNQAEVTHNPEIWSQFMTIYRQSRIGRPVRASYRTFTSGATSTLFFPLHNGRASTDPVMTMLNRVSCTGATRGGNANNRTKIRIIQYSIYGDRGVWIAKKLRQLWNRGCDIMVIYAVSSRPVISILRNASGRGRIPLRQSVITNGRREIVKYNHSKWMTISGVYGGSNGQYMTMSGSANWSRFAFTGDEQLQIISSAGQVSRHNAAFNITWRQKSSHQPGFGIKAHEARMTEAQRIALIPEEPTWGKGIYKYMTAGGE